MGKYITTGKFKPDGKGGLIQTESDLNAFKKLFGEYRDAQKGIYNVASDLQKQLQEISFYTQLLLDDQQKNSCSFKTRQS